MRTLLNIVLGFFRFWYDFIIGDCWQLALGVAVILAGGVLLVRSDTVGETILPILVSAAVMAMVVFTAILEWRLKSAKQKP